MDQWMEFFSSPLWHLAFSMIMLPLIFGVWTTTLGSGEKRVIAGFLMYGWSQSIFLTMVYWTGPGYGLVQAIRDSYEGVAPPLVPIMLFGAAQILGFYLTISGFLKSERPRPLLAARLLH